MHGFSLEHPWVLLIGILFFVCNRYCKARFEKYYIPHIDFVLKSDVKVFNIEILKWLSVFFLLLSLSSPVYKKGYVQAVDEGIDIVLTLDLSGSMRYPMEDGRSRFSALKEVVNEFIQKRKDNRVGIVSFGSFAAVTAPLSFDYKIVQDMFDKQYVGVVGEKTALYDALFQTYLLLEDSDAKSKVVILFTDGINNDGSTPKEVIKQIIQDTDIKLYTIGLGQADSTSLKEFAQLGNGKFFEVDDKKSLYKVYETIDNLEKSEIQSDTKPDIEYYYQLMLFLSLLGFMFYLYSKTQRGLK